MSCAWDPYISQLVGDEAGAVQAAAICGCQPGAESTWACSKGSPLENITQGEIQKLVLTDRENLFIHGVMLGGRKYALINDHFCDEEPWFVMRTKDGTNTSIVVRRTKTAVILALGKPGDPRSGDINVKVGKIAKYLFDSGI